MKTKHTQGPWQIVDTQDVGLHIKTVDFDLIATLANGDNFFAKNPQNEANARLIAAAPELLDALLWVRDNCTGLPAVARAIAEKAISKAQGEL